VALVFALRNAEPKKRVQHAGAIGDDQECDAPFSSCTVAGAGSSPANKLCSISLIGGAALGIGV
jgi:hypothetical protein